jgi:hypothetical protein
MGPLLPQLTDVNIRLFLDIVLQCNPLRFVTAF